MLIRDISREDLPGLLELNNAHAAEVNELTMEDLARALDHAAGARIVSDGLGFVIAFDESAPSQGPNHAWFLARQQPFLYVDRIVVAVSARRLGHARSLYRDLESRAGDRPLCCEVNIDPANAGSLAFHERLGFSPCGEATDPRNGKRVRYLWRPRPRNQSTDRRPE